MVSYWWMTFFRNFDVCLDIFVNHFLQFFHDGKKNSWLNHNSLGILGFCHLKSLRLQHDSECCYCWKSLANRLEAFKHDAFEALRVGCLPWIEMGKRLIYEKGGDADVVVNQEYDDFLWFGDHVSMIFYDFESSKSHLVKVWIRL